DPPSPIIEYGRQKAAVEARLREGKAPYLILRLAKVFGREPGDGSVLTASAAAMTKGEKVLAAEDQIQTMIEAGDLARLVAGLIDSGATGIFHIAGRQRYS